jgi:autotransporter-associated beta strand protein
MAGVFQAKSVLATATNFVWQGTANDGNWSTYANWYNMSTKTTATTFPGNPANQSSANGVITDAVYDASPGYFSGPPVLPATISIPVTNISIGTISFGDNENNGDFTLSSNVSLGSPSTTITLTGSGTSGLERLASGKDGTSGPLKGNSYSATSGVQTILSNLICNASQTWAIGGPSGELLLQGKITNAAGQTLIKSGSGELEIASNNSSGFAGGFTLQGGTILLDDSNSIGAGTSAVQVANTTSTANASLLINSGVTFIHDTVTVANTKNVSLTLGGTSNQSSSVWAGKISLDYPASLTGGATGTTTFSGVLSDGVAGSDDIGNPFNFANSTITKINTGTVVLSASNTYSGGTNVSAGTLTGTVLSAFGTGPVVINPTGTANTSSDAATVNTTYSISPLVAVTVNSNSPTAVGTINFNGVAETIGSLAGTGNVVLANASGKSLVTGNSSNTQFSGSISDANGTGSLTKVGSGIFTLSGSSTYGGGTNVSAGTLLVTNTGGSATGSGRVLIGPSASLGGGGFISGPVTVNGTVAPGLANTSSAAVLTLGSGSILSGTTTLDLTAPAVSDEILFGPSGTGSATFGGTLNVADTTGFTFASGQQYTLFGFNSGTGQFSISLPNLPSGLVWDTSSLYQTGILSIISSSGSSGVWASASSGNWETGGNWVGGTIASAAGQSATFADSSASSITVTLSAGETVGTVNFNGSAGTTAYTLTGSNTLTLSSGTSAPALIAVSAGTQTINVPVTLSAGLNINTAAGSSLTIGGSVNGNVGALTVTAGSSLIVSPSGVLNVPVISAGSLTFANNSTGSTYLSRTLPSLNLGGGAVTLAAGSQTTRQLLDIGSSGLSGTGSIDLTNNDLLLQGGGASGLQQITALIKQGYGTNGSWQGSGGITSSAAAADPTKLTALGVILNQSLLDPLKPLYNSFDSAPSSEGDILVKYTYYGDADLNGVVDGTDYSRIDNGYLNKLSGWVNGDFNYDGVVDGSDYTLIDNAFNSQGSPLAAEIAAPTAEVAGSGVSSAVPEPGTFGLIGIGLVGLLGRRKRIGRRGR